MLFLWSALISVFFIIQSSSCISWKNICKWSSLAPWYTYFKETCQLKLIFNLVGNFFFFFFCHSERRISPCFTCYCAVNEGAVILGNGYILPMLFTLCCLDSLAMYLFPVLPARVWRGLHSSVLALHHISCILPLEFLTDTVGPSQGGFSSLNLKVLL